MATLNGMGRSHADSLIASGKVNKTASWSFSAEDGNAMLGPNGDDWANYGKHHLGLDAAQPNDTKDHWKYPFAKGGTLYRSALTAIRQRAGQQNDTAIFDTAGALLSKIDGDGNQARAKLHLVSNRATIYGFRVIARSDQADIYLYGPIGSSFWEDGVSAKQFADELKKLGAVKTIHLRMNSDGGDVMDARAMYTLLQQHPARVIAHVDGVAASAASFLMMAANEIEISEGAFVMIHDPYGGVMGSAKDMRQMADLLDTVSGTIRETYAARTKRSIDEIKAWMEAETWFTGKEAVENGFADRMVENLKVTASIRKPERFKHIPAALRPEHQRAAAALQRIAAFKK